MEFLDLTNVFLGFSALLLGLLVLSYLRLTKNAELFYAERNQRDAILNSLYDGVIQYDENSRVVLMNPKAEELLGVKFKDVAGISVTPELAQERPNLKGLVELMYPALAVFASMAKELPGTSAKLMEIHISNPELKLLVTQNNVVDEHGNTRGFLKVLHDLSREQLVSKIKSEFVSIAAHQLRTPLSAIKWTLKLLLEGDAGAMTREQTEFLQKGYEINERMICLISDLLNAARIEEGRFGYEFKEIDIKKFLTAAYENAMPFARSRAVELKFAESEKEFPPVFADEEKLSLVINNLLDNAVKYTPEGGKVTMTLSREGDFALVKVEDTGVGVPDGEQSRVFSKFFRASNALRMQTEGTGLGLFIVFNIVKRHGGVLKFVSKIGRGSTFTFTIPFKKELIPQQSSPALEQFLETI